MTTKVAVIGAAGRMGATVCDGGRGRRRPRARGPLRRRATTSGDLGGADVVVEFTVPSVLAPPTSAGRSRAACRCRRRHHGLEFGARSRRCASRTTRRVFPAVGVLIAPNFAIGAILMMELRAARRPAFYESVEVIELHHPNKVDAPSGHRGPHGRHSSRAARDRSRPRPAVPDATTDDPDGARGARRWTACRRTQCACAGWSPTRRSSSAGRARCSRSATTPSTGSPSCRGSSTAVRRVGDHPGVTVGLEHYLGL
jgi:4-hydroxy-tetrahydrodipicolinate reductase